MKKELCKMPVKIDWEALLKLFRSNRISQTLIADSVNVSLSAISHYSSGRSVPNYRIASAIYNLALDSLNHEAVSRCVDYG